MQEAKLSLKDVRFSGLHLYRVTNGAVFEKYFGHLRARSEISPTKDSAKHLLERIQF